MASRIIGLQNGIVTLLNGATFSQPFTATRSTHKKEYEPSDLETLRIDVGYAGVETARATRNSQSNDYAIYISVEKRLANLNADADAMTEFLEELRDFLFRASNGVPVEGNIFQPVGVSLDVQSEAFDEQRFEGMLSVVYRELAST